LLLHRGLSRFFSLFALIAVLIIYGLQLRSLYTVPVYDSVRWGGDETWLMREFGNQAMHGVMQYPEQFGQPARTDGVLAGSMWFDALIYGVSGNIVFPSSDLANIGRTVTAILGLLLIASFYFILRKLDIVPILAACSVGLMVLSQGFLWATHSARYDLLTGLTLIWYCYYLSRLVSTGKLNPVSSAIFGIASISIIIFSRHMLTLGFPATIICLWMLRIWKNRATIFSYLAGAIGAAAVISLIYWIGAGEFSLLGRGGSLGSYGFVIGQIPILRPFSRSVQVSNLLQRFHLFLLDQTGIILLLAIAILLALSYKIWHWRLSRRGVRLRLAITEAQQFFLVAATCCTISWLLLEGSRPYYFFHIAPLVIIGGAIVLEVWTEVYPSQWQARAIGITIPILGIFLQAGHALPATVLGDAIEKDQSSAIQRLLQNAVPINGHKPRVLFDVAGLDRALTDTEVQVLTLDMFQPPPNATEAVEKLTRNQIDYVVLRSSQVSTPFEPGRALLPHVLDSIGDARDSALGFFYDDGRTYDESLSQLIDQGLDTLRLYRTRWTPQ
jgi:hypothetical protein